MAQWLIMIASLAEFDSQHPWQDYNFLYFQLQGLWPHSCAYTNNHTHNTKIKNLQVFILTPYHSPEFKMLLNLLLTVLIS